jgi:hypothetical protein
LIARLVTHGVEWLHRHVNPRTNQSMNRLRTSDKENECPRCSHRRNSHPFYLSRSPFSAHLFDAFRTSGADQTPTTRERPTRNRNESFYSKHLSTDSISIKGIQLPRASSSLKAHSSRLGHPADREAQPSVQLQFGPCVLVRSTQNFSFQESCGQHTACCSWAQRHSRAKNSP